MTDAIYKPVQTKSIDIEETEDGIDKITVPVSSQKVDRDGDWFTEQGLEDLKEQLNEDKIAMFPDHGYGEYSVFDMIGYWNEAEISDGVLYANGYFEPENDMAEKLKKKLKNDMPVSFSVGFQAQETTEGEKGEGVGFESIDLMEISPVGVGSNREAVTSNFAKSHFSDRIMKRLDEIEYKITDKKDNEENDAKDMEENMTEEDESKEEEKQDDADSPTEEAVGILADEYDADASEIRDALEPIISGKQDEDEDEEEDEDMEEESSETDEGKVVDYDEVKEMVKEALDELEDSEENKSTEPKGKITQTSESSEEVSYEDEENSKGIKRPKHLR